MTRRTNLKPERQRVLWEGLGAGLIGYAVVAVFYGAVNLVSGRSVFHTAAALGARLAGIEAAADEVVIAPAAIFAYNGVHLMAFLVIGLAAAWLVHETELHPEAVLLTLFGGIAGAVFSLLAFVLLTRPVSAALPWWSLAGANLIAGAAIGAYLLRAHRGLLHRVGEGESTSA